MPALSSVRVAARRSIRSLLAIPLIIVLPAVVLGATIFGDVPTDHMFYTDVTAVANAGIATGCGGGNYCPDANVTRGQMAAFLNRTGGRIGYSGFTPTSQGLGGVASLAAVTMQPGPITGGTGFVHLHATIEAHVNVGATGFPVVGKFWIRELGTTAVIADTYGRAQVDEIAGDTSGYDMATIDLVVAAPTGVAKTYELVGQREFGTAALWGKGSLTAEFFPFSENGDNVLGE